MQTRLWAGEQRCGDEAPMCTISAALNGHYEHKVRLAHRDYTHRAKLVLLMMMCIGFSEG